MFFSSLLSSAKWYPVLFDTPLNATRAAAFWLTAALLIAFALCLIFFKAERRKKFLKISGIFGVIYAATVGLILLSLTFTEDGIVLMLFAPLSALIAVIAASAVILLFKRGKLTYIICGCASAAAIIAVFVCMGIHYSSGAAGDITWVPKEAVNEIALYLSAAILLAAVTAAAILCDKRNKFTFDSKSVAFAGVCIAMSFALSYLRIVRMPQGGSITPASLLPLMLYAYMFGTKKGVFAGSCYGLLQALQSPDGILHPAQFILDFPAAFACIGLAGMFSGFKPLEKLPQIQFLLGGIIGGLGRFIMHFLSGTFAFGLFAPEGQPAWLYSLGYQAGYVLPDIAIAITLGVIALCSPALVKTVKKYGAHKTAENAVCANSAED